MYFGLLAMMEKRDNDDDDDDDDKHKISGYGRQGSKIKTLLFQRRASPKFHVSQNALD